MPPHSAWYAPSPLGIVPDGLTTGSVGNQCLEMLLRIAARQEQPVSIVEDGYVALGVKECGKGVLVQKLLIEERERLGIAGYHYPFCCAGEKRPAVLGGA